MKCKQPHPGFELRSSCPFPMMITMMLKGPPYNIGVSTAISLSPPSLYIYIHIYILFYSLIKRYQYDDWLNKLRLIWLTVLTMECLQRMKFASNILWIISLLKVPYYSISLFRKCVLFYKRSKRTIFRQVSLRTTENFSWFNKESESKVLQYFGNPS